MPDSHRLTKDGKLAGEVQAAVQANGTDGADAADIQVSREKNITWVWPGYALRCFCLGLVSKSQQNTS